MQPAETSAASEGSHSTATSPIARSRFSVTAFGLTDRGLVRATNEDHFLISELNKSMRIWQTSLPEPRTQTGDDHGHLFLVADGMGGHRGGERASALAIVAIEHFMLNTFKWFFGGSKEDSQRALGQFQTALSEVDSRVVAEGHDHPELAGMGTTVTMAFQLNSHLCVVHVGDSRAYLLRRGTLTQLTDDDTLTAQMVREGVLAPEDASQHRYRHVITNVVGGPDEGVRVQALSLALQDDDCLLLCSDGLTEMVSAEAIAALLKSEPDPKTAVTTLVARANDAGGKDNITVVLARFRCASTATASVEHAAAQTPHQI
jgi:protein phosphatase